MNGPLTNIERHYLAVALVESIAKFRQACRQIWLGEAKARRQGQARIVSTLEIVPKLAVSVVPLRSRLSPVSGEEGLPGLRACQLSHERTSHRPATLSTPALLPILLDHLGNRVNGSQQAG